MFWGKFSVSDINQVMVMATESEKYVLLLDQTYNSDSNDDSDLSAEEYLKEMETILRKIRKKRTKIAGTYFNFFFK